MNLDKILFKSEKKTSYRDGDKCITMFNAEYPTSEVLLEAANQSRVSDAGINVPAMRAVTPFGDKWAIVTDFVDGKTFAQIIAEYPEKKEEYLAKFVNLQLEIFSKKCPLLNRQSDKIKQKLLKCELKASTRFDLLRKLEILPKHDKICHGNFSLQNIIEGKDGKLYVVDWSDATQGNASADVARTYLLFWLGGDISGASRYLELFCEKSHTDKSYFEKWLPLVAASRYVKGNENEREFLRSWIEREHE